MLRLFSIAFVLILSASVIHACSCAFGGGGVCQDYWKAKAVFIGTVIDIKTVTFKREGYDEQRRLVRFSIDESSRGVEGAQVEVLTGFGGGDCGFGFKQSHQYLIYAHEAENGQLQTSICTRTKEISKAGEDLTYIRGLPTAKAGAKLTIEVVKHSRSPDGALQTTPLPHIQVTIEGQDQHRSAKTDVKGQIVLEGLPPGEYVASALLPRGLTAGESERKVSIADRGCAFIYYGLEADGQLNGRILRADGLPVAHAEIFMIPADKARYQGHSDFAYSEEDGRYGFRRTPPGRYVLIMRFDGMTSQTRPFPTVYYPGVAEKSEAKVFNISEGERIDNFDLIVPPLPPEYNVEGVIVDSTGQPSANARLGYLMAGDSVLYSPKLGDRGAFSFKAYEGLQLVMRASLEVEKGKYIYSDWVNVTVAAGAPSIKIVLPNH